MNEDWALPWTGQCLCGDLQFEISAPPLLSMACHCRGCQRLTASAFSLSVMVPAEGFRVTKGEGVKGGLRGPHGQFFCDSCKSWVYSEPHGIDWIVNVRTMMLDEPRWDVPFIEVMTDERLPWVDLPARHGFAAFPEMDDYQRLIADYAENGARPGTG
ncbi:MAG: GFA family protein [Parasphingopyxis sp.]|uniref:GFA family protein n=1 Tax=Parasphingopyxis sp. TaxID=1920299 RepID=UPI003F9F141A